MRTVSFTIFLLMPFLKSALSERYDPTWDSLDKRPIPTWYDDVKFGIFMHWGVYAVPALHDAWFWWYWKGNSPWPDVVEFMKRNYPPNFTYADFATKFTAELFDANEFASVVKKSGAKYFVLTSKHHEGFTMWPSNYSWNWNSWDLGAHQDIVGDLSRSMRSQNIHFGLYYSLFAWFHPLYVRDKKNAWATQQYVQDITLPQMREIINIYRPDILWNDGAYQAPSKYWNATEFIAWLYNDSPVKDTILTNDRWGSETQCLHGDFYTCTDKYNPRVLQKHKWENCMTVDRYSWGFRRNARSDDFLTIQELIENLVTTISCGGNLLMNVGPTHYGKIAPIFEERLVQMGVWLKINGEAVYGSKPWIYQNDTLTPDIWYTSKVRTSEGLSSRRIYNPQKKDDTVVYAFVLQWPEDNQLKLASFKWTDQAKVSMLGCNGTLPVKPLKPSGIMVDFSSLNWSRLPNFWAWTLKLDCGSYVVHAEISTSCLDPSEKVGFLPLCAACRKWKGVHFPKSHRTDQQQSNDQK